MKNIDNMFMVFCEKCSENILPYVIGIYECKIHGRESFVADPRELKELCRKCAKEKGICQKCGCDLKTEK